MFRDCLAIALLGMLGLVGCGGSGGPGEPGAPAPGGDTLTLGSLRVDVASAAGFRTAALTSPDFAPIAFTALYGSKITRLEEVGYGTIGYVSRADGDWELMEMNADGTNPRKLTRNTADDGPIAYSPDGGRIAFASDRDGDDEIFVANRDGSGATKLTKNLKIDRGPDWSPDGRRIAFVSDRDGDGEIFVMNADGSSVTQLTSNGDPDDRPDWSPDGRQIAYQMESMGDSEIMVMNADGSDQHALTGNGVEDAGPDWSPDGHRIAFGRLEQGQWDLYVMDENGDDQTHLTSGPHWERGPRWRPDGLQIAFTSTRTGANEIFVMDASGLNQRNVTKRAGNDANPTWVPVPSAVRALIGKAASDGGADPPFGTQKPLAIVGVRTEGLASAVTIGLAEAQWSTVKVSPLDGTGAVLVGAKIIASRISSVQEDTGRGREPRKFAMTGFPKPSAVLVFIDAFTGHVASVVASADTALDTPASIDHAGARIALRGSFTEAYDARQPGLNRVGPAAHGLALDAKSGYILTDH